MECKICLRQIGPRFEGLSVTLCDNFQRTVVNPLCELFQKYTFVNIQLTSKGKRLDEETHWFYEYDVCAGFSMSCFMI